MNFSIINTSRRNSRLLNTSNNNNNNSSTPSSPNSTTSSLKNEKTPNFHTKRTKDLIVHNMNAEMDSIQKKLKTKDSTKKIYKTQKFLINSSNNNVPQQMSPSGASSAPFKRKYTHHTTRYEHHHNHDVFNNTSNSLINNSSNRNLIYDYSKFEEEDFTPKKFKQKEEYFVQKLIELRDRLNAVREIGYLSSNINEAISILNKKNDEFMHNYLSDLRQAERKSDESLSVVRVWHEKQTSEIEQIYQCETKRATQEFQDKRTDLKEGLRNEYEEMRKQMELDKTQLDINTDTTEVKPVPTRNLRRRAVGLNPTPSTNPYDFSMDTSALELTSNPLANTSIILQTSMNTSVNIGEALSNLNFHAHFNQVVGLSGANVVGTVLANGAGSGGSGVVGSGVGTIGANSSNNAQSLVDRKRKQLSSAVISIQLADEDLNEDYKLLVKSSMTSTTNLSISTLNNSNLNLNSNNYNNHSSKVAVD
jgi:hypothetical protein